MRESSSSIETIPNNPGVHAGIARGSAAETRYHLLLARDLGYIAREDSDELREEYGRVGQMLTRLTQALR